MESVKRMSTATTNLEIFLLTFDGALNCRGQDVKEQAKGDL